MRKRLTLLVLAVTVACTALLGVSTSAEEPWQTWLYAQQASEAAARQKTNAEKVASCDQEAQAALAGLDADWLKVGPYATVVLSQDVNRAIDAIYCYQEASRLSGVGDRDKYGAVYSDLLELSFRLAIRRQQEITAQIGSAGK